MIILAYTYDRVYIIYLFFTYVCIEGDFPTTYLYIYHFQEGKILYVRDDNFMVMHACDS